MKKAIIALIVSSVLFTLIPQQVKAYDHEVHKQSEAIINSENHRYEPTIEAPYFTQWVIDNSKNSSYGIKSYEIICDTGCWKPEFPNNPFCRIRQ